MAQQNKRRGQERKHERQMSADERQSHRDSINDAQQLATLDRRLGEGVGAQKERARLKQRISENMKVVTSTDKEEETTNG